MATLTAFVGTAIQRPGKPVKANSGLSRPGLLFVAVLALAPFQAVAQVPAAPANMRATIVLPDVHIRWDHPGDPSITGYDWRFRYVGSPHWTPNWTWAKESSADTTAAILQNRCCDVTFEWQLRARNASGPGAAASVTVTVPPRPPTTPSRPPPANEPPAVAVSVCDRTPEVRDAIVGLVPEADSCADVTKVHLSRIDGVLDLDGPHVAKVDGTGTVPMGRPSPLSNLKAGDFSGLSSIEGIYLSFNELTSLPPGIFGGLASLNTLTLHSNPIESLPVDVFAGLTSLERLALELGENYPGNLVARLFAGLTSLRELRLVVRFDTLPAGVFAELSSLKTLDLNNSHLVNLPADLFSGLASLEYLDLGMNQLSFLPEGIFSGLPSLRGLELGGNPYQEGMRTYEPLPITISLERVGEGRFRARAHTGAPFEITVPITAVNGEIDGGSTNRITIPVGSVTSATFTVTRSHGTASSVTVGAADLPSLPPDHSGYVLAKSPDLPLIVLDALGLSFPHFANGESIFSDLVLVNTETTAVRPAIYFFDTEGNPVDAESLVDLSEDLEIQEDGALGLRAELEPLGERTISTHGRGELMTGSVQVTANGPLGGFLRFDSPGLGVAGAGTSPPVSDAIFPARRQAEGINTGAAIRNLTGVGMTVTCRLMQGGAVLEETEIPLAGDGQAAQFIHEMFPGTDTSDFVGSVRCTVSGGGRFTGVALELDAGNRIFTTLPVVPIPR